MNREDYTLEYYLNEDKKKKALQRDKFLYRKYKITAYEYDLMFIKQEGRCAICRTDKSKRRLAIDHNHLTGKVRALLCVTCNIGIGLFRDRPGLIQVAMNYLDEHK